MGKEGGGCVQSIVPPTPPHPTPPPLLAASSKACRGCGHIEHSLSPLAGLSTAHTTGTPALTGVCTPHSTAFVYSQVSVHHSTQPSCTLWCLYTTQHSLRVLSGVCTPHITAFVYSPVFVHHTTQPSCTLWCLYTTQHSLPVLPGVCTPLTSAFVYWCLYTTQHMYTTRHTAFVYSVVYVCHSTHSLRVLSGVCTLLNTQPSCTGFCTQLLPVRHRPGYRFHAPVL